MHKGDLRPALELAKAAPADASSVVTPDGKRYGLRQLKPGIELSTGEGEWSRVLWFPPTDEPPSGLPQGVPFLPGLDTTVTIRHERLLTQWALPDVDPGGIAEAASRRMQAAGPDANKRRDVFRSLAPSPEIVCRLDEVLSLLREALERDGWAVEDEETREVPFPLRRLVLVRGASRTEVARGAIFGLPSITMRELT